MFYLLIFILGLSIGSFLNVIICRLETKESIVLSRSHCPKCGAVLKWHDLIPVFSFLVQKGKCRSCGKKISWQYPLVEMVTGLLFLLVIPNLPSVIPNLPSVIPNLIGNPDYINIYWIPAFAGMTFNLIIICFLIVIFVYDLKHYIIPDKIVYPAIGISLLYLLFIIQYSLFNYLLAALGASGFFLSMVLFSKGKWMGMGDVKLAFLMGLILGWPNILAALFLAFLSGAIIGVALIIFGKKGLKSQIPFGPFLAGATILIMVCGQCSMWITLLFNY